MSIVIQYKRIFQHIVNIFNVQNFFCVQIWAYFM